MPRIRSVHPSQWTDENFVECSFAARLFVIAVRNETDDNGIFEWKPKTLKMKLFPADNIDLEPLLEELTINSQVMRYEVEGKTFGIVRNFQRYQRPEKPKFLYPVPDLLPKGYDLNPKYLPNSTIIINAESANDDSDSAIESQPTRQPVADQSPNLVSEVTGIGTVKGIGKEKNKKGENFILPLPDWLPVQDWGDYLEMRNGKGKGKATNRAKQLVIVKLDDLRRKGHDPASVLQQSIINGWTSVFEIKGDYKNGNNGNDKHQRIREAAVRGHMRAENPDF